jgi:hypothetical protein
LREAALLQEERLGAFHPDRHAEQPRHRARSRTTDRRGAHFDEPA